MYLVTGATGFVGSAVTRQLLARGDAVRVLSRAESDQTNIRDLDVEVVEGDLLKPETLRDAVEGCDGVFHVAADYRLWVRNPEPMFRANVDGARAIVDAAVSAGVERIVYTSSVAVLGNVPGKAADEETPVTYADMIGPYKQSKFRAEEAVRQLIEEKGAPVVIVNPSTPIGPRDVKPTPTGRVIVEAASGKMPAYVDTGLNVVHVDDVAAGHLLAFDNGSVGERYILGGDDMPLADILAIVARQTRRRPPSIKIPHGAVMPIAYLAEAWTRMMGEDEPFVTVEGVRMARKKMFFNSARAERELGYTHRPADQALNDAVTWFRDNGYLR
ncbi:MAG: NAD-dependent epimerase/dehydratase family protein [Alphaproteobacteria bacterium]|nr:NAD-dependent epimerase/dehydratase family protein [Alphaproteobacteria bacterium]